MKTDELENFTSYEETIRKENKIIIYWLIGAALTIVAVICAIFL